jgi:hypothetical protein
VETATYDIDSEFHPHNKHVKSETKLRRRKKITLRVAHLLRAVPREEPMLRFRPKQTEERRPEQYAGQHFRHHLRLAKPRSNIPHKPTEKKNDGKLKKKMNGETQVVHGPENRIILSECRS